MGHQQSKFGEAADKDELSEGGVPSTPKVLPSALDPRSPSLNIVRTPIEVLNTPFSEQNSATIQNENKVVTILAADPRSPTTDFSRTPIIVETLPKMTVKYVNKNLENVRKQIVNNTPIKLKNGESSNLNESILSHTAEDKSVQEIADAVISPKLLKSSPITSKSSENKRNSMVGVLETNMDFVETDLDVIIRSKMSGTFQKTLNLANTESTIVSPDTAVPQGNTPNVSSNECNTSINNTSLTSALVSNAQGNSFDDQTSSTSLSKQSVCELDAVTQVPEEYPELDEVTQVPEENPKSSGPATPDLITDILNVKRNANRNKFDQKNKEKSAFTPNRKGTPNLDEFNRKLTSLIYEDKTTGSQPLAAKSVPTNRTPLGTRNLNEQRKKSGQKLRVSDQPTKKPTSASKIPVFVKDKKIVSKINVQCENTPPSSLIEEKRCMKAKKSRWDADETLII